MSPLVGSTAEIGPCGETSGAVVNGVVVHMCSDGRAILLVEEVLKKNTGEYSVATLGRMVPVGATQLRLADPDAVAKRARRMP